MANEMATEIPIMHCFDNNYVIPAAVSFQSMLKYADPAYRYRLFVLHSDITWQNQEKLTRLVGQFPNASVEFMNMQHQFNDLPGIQTEHGHLTKEVLYKLLAPSIFKQYERLIITDVDVIFKGDILPSYFAFDENENAYYAGVRQINPPNTFLREYYNNCYKKSFNAEEYAQLKICGGYLVVNLKKLREDNMEEVMVRFLEKNVARLFQLEQDVINFCCREKQVIYLPLNYVVCSYMYDYEKLPELCASDPFYTYQEFMDALKHPIQLHYASSTKPWNAPDSQKAEVWHEELEKTEFLQDYEEQRNIIHSGQQSHFPGKRYLEKELKPAKCKVSVICCTYNHNAFIEDALKGILTQKTNFDFEVIVADDASTDATQQIIRKYIEKYPDQMKKCILRKNNVGIGINYFEALSAAEGEYLALCDGDDRWIDDQKLQKQVDFLDQNLEYASVCSDFLLHNVDFTSKKDQEFRVLSYVGSNKKRYLLDDLITFRFMASCTTMYRWMLRGRVPEFLKHYKIIDFPLSLIHASCGYIGVIDEVMSIYNVHSSSISNSEQDSILNGQLCALYEINQMLHFEITQSVNTYIKELRMTGNQVAQVATVAAEDSTEVIKPISAASAVPTASPLKRLVKKVLLLCKKGMRLMPPIVTLVLRWIVPPYFADRIRNMR